MDTPTEKSELTLAAIIDTALGIVATQGLEGLSLGDVAKKMGISKSGVFSRIGSREALHQAVLDEFDRRFLASVFEPAMASQQGLPRLHALIKGWIRRACEDTGCIYVAGAFEYDDVESPLRDYLEKIYCDGVQYYGARSCRRLTPGIYARIRILISWSLKFTA